MGRMGSAEGQEADQEGDGERVLAGRGPARLDRVVEDGVHVAAGVRDGAAELPPAEGHRGRAAQRGQRERGLQASV